MRSLCVTLVSGVLMFAVACGGNYSTPPTSPTPSPAPTPGGTSSSVSIPSGASTLVNRAYAPDQLDIAVGTTVTWSNTDSVAHTSTSDSREWDSATIAPGGQFSLAFQTPGTFPYHCAIHPGMVGTVVVH